MDDYTEGYFDGVLSVDPHYFDSTSSFGYDGRSAFSYDNRPSSIVLRSSRDHGSSGDPIIFLIYGPLILLCLIIANRSRIADAFRMISKRIWIDMASMGMVTAAVFAFWPDTSPRSNECSYLTPFAYEQVVTFVRNGRHGGISRTGMYESFRASAEKRTQVKHCLDAILDCEYGDRQ